MLYRFHDYELDERLYQLRRGGKPINIEPKVFDVLTYLLHHRDCVISKDELIEKLWPGQVISETALTRCIVAARKAVGDDGTKQQVIETQHGQGYRFVAPVTERVVERKLAAVFSADVKGYSRLMREDEVGTVHTLTAYRQLLATLIQQHHGRVVDSPGDNLLAEFASVVDAVQAAVAIQQELKVKNADLPASRKMEFRIGINLGDVIVEGERIYGDGVNIAARLEGLAEAGGVCISGTVCDQVKSKLALRYESLGEQAVKNIAEPVRVWRVRLDSDSAPSAAEIVPSTRSSEDQPPGVAPSIPQPRVWPKRTLVLSGVLLLVGIIVAVQYLSFRPPAPSANIPPEQSQPLPLPDKPSIAVLPFKNLSGDPAQEYFCYAMGDDLITDLSKLSGLVVIAWHSAVTYKGRAVKVQDVSRELGVRYVVEGDVRKDGEQLRIRVRLVDATTGGLVWAERYDRPWQDVFAVQEEVRRKVVVHIGLKLTDEEQARLKRTYTPSPEAYDSVERGWDYLLHFTQVDTAQARQLFEKAIALDPSYAVAYASLGWVCFHEWGSQWNRDPQMLEQMFALAQKALALDGSLSVAHELLAWVYLFRDKQHEAALAEANRALAYGGANWFSAYIVLGNVLNFAGRPEEAIKLREQAMRLSPRSADYLFVLGHAYALTGRYEEAIAMNKEILTFLPDSLYAHLGLASIYSRLGREEEARAEAAEVIRLSPSFSLEEWRQRMPYKDPAIGERALADLRKAGLK